MMLPLELKEFMHNIKDHDYDICGQYKVDKSEADKVIKQLDRLDSMFVNADEIKHDAEVFNDDYSDKNIQNGWIMCEDRLPEKDGDYLCVFKDNYLEDECDYYYEIVEYDEGWNDIRKEDVIAWMPLPQPYKAESEDKE